MTSYRAYVLGADGHFKGVLELECASDAQALDAAAEVDAEFGLELWQGARQLMVLNPVEQPADHRRSA